VVVVVVAVLLLLLSINLPLPLPLLLLLLPTVLLLLYLPLLLLLLPGVLEAIKQGACPDVRHLDLRYTHMGKEHGSVLGEALEARACRRLEELVISGNPSVGEFSKWW